MTGQDAVNAAKTFNEDIELTGVILTKVDGDTRGGAALSVKEVTGEAHQVYRCGREKWTISSRLSRQDGLPHTGNGRCAIADRKGGAGV